MKAAPDFPILGMFGTGLRQHARRMWHGLCTAASWLGADGDQAEDAGDWPHGQARHGLVIFDSRAMAPPVPGRDIIRFHGVRATEQDDAVDGFRARRKVQANAVAISSWDPTPLPQHGSNPIVSGDSTLIIDGKQAARHGDKTACGATLISGQQATIDNI